MRASLTGRAPSAWARGRGEARWEGTCMSHRPMMPCWARGLVGGAAAGARRLAAWPRPTGAPNATSPTVRRCASCSTRVRPSAVFNAAAYTDVDRAESEPEPSTRSTRGRGERSRRRPPRSERRRRALFDGLRVRGRAAAPVRRRRAASPQGRTRRRRRPVTRAWPRPPSVTSSCASAACTGRGTRLSRRRSRAGCAQARPIRARQRAPGSPTWAREVADVSAALARTALMASITARPRARRPGLTSPGWRQAARGPGRCGCRRSGRPSCR